MRIWDLNKFRGSIRWDVCSGVTQDVWLTSDDKKRLPAYRDVWLTSSLFVLYLPEVQRCSTWRCRRTRFPIRNASALLPAMKKNFSVTIRQESRRRATRLKGPWHEPKKLRRQIVSKCWTARSQLPTLCWSQSDLSTIKRDSARKTTMGVY